MLTLHTSHSPMHTTYIGKGRFIDVLGDANGWKALEVSPDGLVGVELASAASHEAVVEAAERALAN